MSGQVVWVYELIKTEKYGNFPKWTAELFGFVVTVTDHFGRLHVGLFDDGYQVSKGRYSEGSGHRAPCDVPVEAAAWGFDMIELYARRLELQAKKARKAADSLAELRLAEGSAQIESRSS